jgi:nucleotide-binding universal stress UspA family protein
MPFGRILVAIDGSDASDRAFEKAIELAEVTRAELTALAIEGRCPPTPRPSERLRRSSGRRTSSSAP